jgi:hypothetical protein
MIKLLSKWIGHAFDSLEWLILEMDVTQWGIVSVIFVVLGFFALRTRI